MSKWTETSSEHYMLMMEYLQDKHMFHKPPMPGYEDIAFSPSYDPFWNADFSAKCISHQLSERAAHENLAPRIVPEGWQDNHSYRLSDTAYHMAAICRENGLDFKRVISDYIDAATQGKAPDFSDKLSDFTENSYSTDDFSITGADLLKQAIKRRLSPLPPGMERYS